MNIKLKAKAPTRIDLAGGTLDLWPLYLFFENTATINCAINQYAEVDLLVGSESKTTEVSSIELISEDRNQSHKFSSYGELLDSFGGTHKALKLPSELLLHAKVLRHFFAFWRKSAPITVTTRCSSPAGAGLGGSSSLCIALCVALRKLTLANYNDEELIGLARDLETTVIEIPAGLQDYWSALFGGAQAIRMEVGKVHRKVFYKQARFIEDHLILCYTGQSRSSGINNWLVYKSFLDKDPTVQGAFSEIVKATYLMEEALQEQSFEKLARSLNKEWEARQKLSSQIATPEMLKVMDFARLHGAQAAKVCGAGGGGCYILAVDANQKSSLKKQLLNEKVHVIDFQVVEDGCVVQEY